MTDDAGTMMTLMPMLIVGLPLAGFLLNGLAGKKIGSERISGIIGSGTVGVSFVLSAVVFFELLGRAPEGRTVTVRLFEQFPELLLAN